MIAIRYVIFYVLLFEENSWLRKSAVKAVSVMALFSLLITVLNLVPNAISFINDFTSIFGGSFYIEWSMRTGRSVGKQSFRSFREDWNR